MGIDRPPGFTYISTQSDQAIETDAEYLVSDSAGAAEPRWTWYFNAPSSWLATALVLNPAATQLGFVTQPSNTLLPGAVISPPVQVGLAVAGVATFSDLSVDQLGMGYTLRAAAAGLPAVLRAPFNVGLP